jgi:hypothetical protein
LVLGSSFTLKTDQALSEVANAGRPGSPGRERTTTVGSFGTKQFGPGEVTAPLARQRVAVAPQRALARTSPAALTHRYYGPGRQLRALGVNQDFAPDADVVTTSAGVIGDRSFGPDPVVDATAVSAAAKPTSLPESATALRAAMRTDPAVRALIQAAAVRVLAAKAKLDKAPSHHLAARPSRRHLRASGISGISCLRASAPASE